MQRPVAGHRGGRPCRRSSRRACGHAATGCGTGRCGGCRSRPSSPSPASSSCPAARRPRPPGARPRARRTPASSTPHTSEPRPVGMPFVTARSFSEYGTPQSGPAVPSAQAAEARRASARARSAVTVTNALMPGSSRSIRASVASATSTGSSVRRANASSSSAADSAVTSSGTVGGDPGEREHAAEGAHDQSDRSATRRSAPAPRRRRTRSGPWSTRAATSWRCRRRRPRRCAPGSGIASPLS